MVRTQIQLTDDQVRTLRQISAVTGKSMADLVRQGVDLYLRARKEGSSDDRTARALSVVGQFASGAADVSTDHDRYLDDAFGV